jgi:hypothetical protein
VAANDAIYVLEACVDQLPGVRMPSGILHGKRSIRLIARSLRRRIKYTIHAQRLGAQRLRLAVNSKQILEHVPKKSTDFSPLRHQINSDVYRAALLK